MIETRTYNIYDGLEIIADREKWGGNMTIIEYKSSTIKKSTGVCTLKTAVCKQPVYGHAQTGRNST